MNKLVEYMNDHQVFISQTNLNVKIFFKKICTVSHHHKKSLYLRFRVFATENLSLFLNLSFLFYSHSWSFYMQIHYVQAHCFGLYLSHITRDTCIINLKVRWKKSKKCTTELKWSQIFLSNFGSFKKIIRQLI
jgi:hypothetical protein